MPAAPLQALQAMDTASNVNLASLKATPAALAMFLQYHVTSRFMPNVVALSMGGAAKSLVAGKSLQMSGSA